MKSYLPLKVVLHRVGEPLLEDYGASRVPLDSPQLIFEFWQSVIASKPEFEPEKENLFVILLDAKLRPKCYHLTALGSLNECTAHPLSIFRPAIVDAAYAFVLAHNHPSGEPQPSEADRRLTNSLRKGAALLQIKFLDHVVIGQPSASNLPFFSFREAGLL
jgi:DNA repair protein RadC